MRHSPRKRRSTESTFIRQLGHLVSMHQLPSLQLSFDGCLIYNRPYLPNLLSLKFIEYILSKGNSLSVYMESKEIFPRRTVEFQPARYIRWIENHQLNVEIKVQNLMEVSLQHLAIT